MNGNQSYLNPLKSNSQENVYPFSDSEHIWNNIAWNTYTSDYSYGRHILPNEGNPYDKGEGLAKVSGNEDKNVNFSFQHHSGKLSHSENSKMGYINNALQNDREALHKGSYGISSLNNMFRFQNEKPTVKKAKTTVKRKPAKSIVRDSYKKSNKKKSVKRDLKSDTSNLFGSLPFKNGLTQLHSESNTTQINGTEYSRNVAEYELYCEAFKKLYTKQDLILCEEYAKNDGQIQHSNYNDLRSDSIYFSNGHGTIQRSDLPPLESNKHSLLEKKKEESDHLNSSKFSMNVSWYLYHISIIWAHIFHEISGDLFFNYT